MIIVQVLEPIINAAKAIWKELKPPRALSWQTVIMFSLTAWLMSLLAQNIIVKELFAQLGSIFFTAGVGWGTWGLRWNLWGLSIRPGHWITGAIASGLVIYGWLGNLQAALVWWPLVSVAIAIAPRFFPGAIFTVPPPDIRQELIVLGLLGFTLSGWIKFHFLVQDWLRGYPSLLGDDFSRSAFVVRLDRSTIGQEPRGTVFLNQAETILRRELQQGSWSDAERWLIDAKERVPQFKEKVLQTVAPLPEDEWWILQGEVPPNEPEYTLKMRAFWIGPTSKTTVYYVEKSCRITQNPAAVNPTNAGQIAPIAPIQAPVQIQCDPVSDRIWYQVG